MTHTQDGAINAIAAGCLPGVIAALVAANIETEFWIKILSTVRGFDLYRYDRDTDIGMDRDIDIDIVV